MSSPEPIPEAFHELLARPVLMSLATTLADRTIQLTPVWFNFDGSYIYFNSKKNRLKHRIIRRRPTVSLLILDPDNKARWLAVRGTVVEMVDDVNREHTNALTMKYMGVPQFGAPPEEQRVCFKVCPEHIAAAELYAPPSR
ncbi:MAG: TIGR03618 family F420-dependent PPOX class oxidoreductase [Caldilineaceae bacterium]